MPLLELLSASPEIFAIVIATFSLLIGSFLNVVIHRLPIMLDRAWRAEAAEIFKSPPNPALEKLPASAKYNLVVPRSACPHCGQQISALKNIPVIS
jgi:leader peptidase (prepilin peptidase)/N-methyltransferase